MKRLLIGLIVALCMVNLFSKGKLENKNQGDNPKLVLRYAENQPYDYPTTKAANKFAELVKERTNGEIVIEVFYDAALGDEKSVIEQMQFGAIDFTRVSLSSLAEFNKMLNILQLPYLYRDSKHMWTVLNGTIGDLFLNCVSENDLIGLSWFDAGARNFYNSVRPIRNISDLQGLNIRVQESQQMMDMVSALGANPMPMSYGDVYSGLLTGTIDGAENNWPSYESTSHYEVAKYYVVDEHTRVPEMQMISAHLWNKLSIKNKLVIKQAAKESAEYERLLWAEKEHESMEQVIKSGTVVTNLSIEEKMKFKKAMDPLYLKYCKGYESIIEDIQKSL